MPDISTFAGANWTGYAYQTTDNGDRVYARQPEARPVWSGRPVDRSRFQTRGSLRVVRIGSVCPECWLAYRPNGGCGCD